MADVFKALADETRRVLLDELAQRDEQTLFELCARLATRHGLASSRQAVSQHLEVLERAGLVRTERRGRYKLHTIDTTPIRQATTRHPWLQGGLPGGLQDDSTHPPTSPPAKDHR